MLIESVLSISPSLADFPSETLNCFPLTTINNILGASSVPEALRTPVILGCYYFLLVSIFIMFLTAQIVFFLVWKEAVTDMAVAPAG